MTRFLSGVLFLTMLAIAVSAVLQFSKPQYAETESSTYLSIKTYIDAKGQITHPSIVEFDTLWNGFRYWFAYTPYPYGNGGEENPSIAVSNDLINWHTPTGLYNPIANNEEVNCDELKDSHLVYREDLNRLEMWYMGRLNSTIAAGGDLLMFRKWSVDGVNWSEYEVMKIMNGTTSPSIIYEDGKYKLWAISASSRNTKNGQLLYYESGDGFEWSECQSCVMGADSLLMVWHGSVSRNGQYEFVWIEDSGNSNVIHYACSEDGINFTAPQSVVHKGAGWRAFYRPYLHKSNGVYYLFYGVITHENEWFVTYSQGDSVNALAGYHQGVPQHTNYYVRIVKNIYKALDQYFRIELLLLGFVGAVLMVMVRRRIFGIVWLFCWAISFVYNYMIYGVWSPIDLAYMLCSCGIISLLVTALSSCIAAIKLSRISK